MAENAFLPHRALEPIAGQIAAGSIRAGDPVYVLPAGRRTTVLTIATFDGDLPAAHGPMSVTLSLRDEIDISRGDMISAVGSVPHAARHLEATVVWMHPDALETHKPYLIKHTTQTVKAEIKSIRHRRVELLFAGTEPYGVWFAGLRRGQSPARSGLKQVDDFRLPSGQVLTKVSPLAAWTNTEVWDYLKANGIPVLPL